ncbi:MAG: sporulation protein YqfD [Firmicutes bacterium]|nr:sporulation protein YqfD [Bacillota bacterium]MDH7495019.1 sporulation protein YqfD [Bacillota bacterium]
MLLAALWPYLRGYVIITVKGRALEKFVNTALARGIDLWDITRVDDRSLVARAYLHDLSSLGKALRETGCRGRIEEKIGVPFLVRRLARRKGLVAGLVLFSVTLYVVSSFVWFVDVSGVQRTDPALVLELAKKHGLRPGAWKRSIDSREVARGILADLPSLAWAAVHIKGTMASIEVAEKTLPDVSPGVVDVVAAEDALVTNLIVLSGEPLVSEGDTVAKGQVLIAGLIRGADDRHGEREAVEVVNARGIVVGRVWRTHSEELRLVREVASATGRVATTRRFTVGALTLVVGPKEPPFTDYEEERSSYRVPIRGGVWSSFGVDVTTYREIARRVEVLDREAVLSETRARARGALEARLPSGAKILDVREDVRYSQGGAIVFTMTMETTEDIALERRQERGVERSDGS